MYEKIQVDALARVEGEGGLYIALDGDSISELRLDIYEPPRFFEEPMSPWAAAMRSCPEEKASGVPVIIAQRHSSSSSN